MIFDTYVLLHCTVFLLLFGGNMLAILCCNANFVAFVFLAFISTLRLVGIVTVVIIA